MKMEKERRLFEETDIRKAILHMAIPTIAGQIILVMYNMADMFFIGLTANDGMLAAVTVCMPAFMFLSAISNLFGIGGASVISRLMGAGSRKLVGRASGLAFWGCFGLTILYSGLVWIFLDPFVDLLGGTEPSVHHNAVQYLICTVILGGSLTSCGVLLSHLIRAEGRAFQASLGIALGGVLNIALDPLLMFVLLPKGNEALGAAIATVLSNTISFLYFLTVLLYNRKKSCLSFSLSPAVFRGDIPAAVLSAGLPACIMTLFENTSYIVLDKLISLCGLPMQTGIGVAKKINMLSHCIVRGIAQGSLPLIGYSFASGNRERMRDAVRMSHRLAVLTAMGCMIVSFVFAKPLAGIFIRSGTSALSYGTVFLRILCIGGPFSASAYTYISFFQAVGEGKKSFVLATLRKGVVDIPLMLLLGNLIPVYGAVMATPITDAVCCLAANMLFYAYIHHLNAGTVPMLKESGA